MIAAGGADRRLRQLSTLLVDRHQRVRALVRVDPDCHHASVSFLQMGMHGIGRWAYPSRATARSS
jgi:hypothetical protein